MGTIEDVLKEVIRAFKGDPEWIVKIIATLAIFCLATRIHGISSEDFIIDSMAIGIIIMMFILINSILK